MIVSTEAGMEGTAAKGKVPPALVALVAPDVGMQRQARVGGVWFAFLVAWVAALLLAFAVGAKADAREATLKEMEMSGQLNNMSDRQIDEETTSATRKFQVIEVAKGVVFPPLELAGMCVSVLLLSWFLRGRLRGSAVAPVAAATLLPNAVADLLSSVSALRHPSLSPGSVELIPRTVSDLAAAFGHPLMGPWMRLGNAVDFFSLWGALLLGYGMVVAGNLPVRRALVGTFVAWVLFRLVFFVVLHSGG